MFFPPLPPAGEGWGEGKLAKIFNRKLVVALPSSARLRLEPGTFSRKREKGERT
jgi:hypothetical protein